jgi:hypothetical protein
MSLLSLAFERRGAHALAVLGTLIGVVFVVLDQWVAGIAVSTASAWGFVLGYLGYVWRRLRRERRHHEWSSGEQFVALGLFIARDARFGTAPASVVGFGFLGVAASFVLLFTLVDPLALPRWGLILFVVFLVPLFLPLGLGATSYRHQRYNETISFEEY